MRGTSKRSNAPVMESGVNTLDDWSEKVCPACASKMGDSAPLSGGRETVASADDMSEWVTSEVK